MHFQPLFIRIFFFFFINNCINMGLQRVLNHFRMFGNETVRKRENQAKSINTFLPYSVKKRKTWKKLFPDFQPLGFTPRGFRGAITQRRGWVPKNPLEIYFLLLRRAWTPKLVWITPRWWARNIAWTFCKRNLYTQTISSNLMALVWKWIDGWVIWLCQYAKGYCSYHHHQGVWGH